MAKPLVSVMNWECEEDEDDRMGDIAEEDEDEDFAEGCRSTGLLIIRAARAILADPALWYKGIGTHALSAARRTRRSPHPPRRQLAAAVLHGAGVSPCRCNAGTAARGSQHA